jgi:hypothetical protein
MRSLSLHDIDMKMQQNHQRKRPSRRPPPPPTISPRSPTTVKTTQPTEFQLFWDYENVPLPTNTSDPSGAAKALFQVFFNQFLFLGGQRIQPKTNSLYFSDNDSSKMTTDLSLSWNLRYIPNPRKKPQIVDFAILRDLQRCEGRTNTLFIGIITGDTDFLKGASKLQDLGHHVYTVLPKNAGAELQKLPCLGIFPKDILPHHASKAILQIQWHLQK